MLFKKLKSMQIPELTIVLGKRNPPKIFCQFENRNEINTFLEENNFTAKKEIEIVLHLLQILNS